MNDYIEFIDGEKYTLSEILNSGEQILSEVEELLRQVLESSEYAAELLYSAINDSEAASPEDYGVDEAEGVELELYEAYDSYSRIESAADELAEKFLSIADAVRGLNVDTL